jgi:hypothetical protein
VVATESPSPSVDMHHRRMRVFLGGIVTDPDRHGPQTCLDSGDSRRLRGSGSSPED